MRLPRFLFLPAVVVASAWGMTPSTHAEAPLPHRVFEAPSIVGAPGWTAACYGSVRKMDQCTVTRELGGAPARLEVTAPH